MKLKGKGEIKSADWPEYKPLFGNQVEKEHVD